MGMLAGGARPRGVGKDFSFMFVAFDPGLLMPSAEFDAHLNDLIAAVRAVPATNPKQAAHAASAGR
jgi:hypothetical protein